MDAYTGNDIVEIDGRNITDWAGGGDVFIITYPTEKSATRVSKNGNANASRNTQGVVGEAVIKLLRGSPDDKYFNSKFIAWDNGLDSFSPFNGTATKVIKSSDGSVTNDVNTLTFGFPVKIDNFKMNVEADTEQDVVQYTVRFKTTRALA